MWGSKELFRRFVYEDSWIAKPHPSSFGDLRYFLEYDIAAFIRALILFHLPANCYTCSKRIKPFCRKIHPAYRERIHGFIRKAWGKVVCSECYQAFRSFEPIFRKGFANSNETNQSQVKPVPLRWINIRCLLHKGERFVPGAPFSGSLVASRECEYYAYEEGSNGKIPTYYAYGGIRFITETGSSYFEHTWEYMR